jgi:hypothetical protein
MPSHLVTHRRCSVPRLASTQMLWHPPRKAVEGHRYQTTLYINQETPRCRSIFSIFHHHQIITSAFPTLRFALGTWITLASDIQTTLAWSYHLHIISFWPDLFSSHLIPKLRIPTTPSKSTTMLRTLAFIAAVGGASALPGGYGEPAAYPHPPPYAYGTGSTSATWSSTTPAPYPSSSSSSSSSSSASLSSYSSSSSTWSHEAPSSYPTWSASSSSSLTVPVYPTGGYSHSSWSSSSSSSSSSIWSKPPVYPTAPHSDSHSKPPVYPTAPHSKPPVYPTAPHSEGHSTPPHPSGGVYPTGGKPPHPSGGVHPTGGKPPHPTGHPTPPKDHTTTETATTYTTLTTCPVTYTSGTETKTSLTTSIVTVTSCKHGCTPAEPTTTHIPGTTTSVIYSTSTYPVTETLTSFVPHSSPVYTHGGTTYYSTSLSITHVLTSYISTVTNTPVSPVTVTYPGKPGQTTPVEDTCPPTATVYINKPAECPPAAVVTVTETIYAGMPLAPTDGPGSYTTETATITLGSGQTTTMVISYTATATNTPHKPNGPGHHSGHGTNPPYPNGPSDGSNPPSPTGTGSDHGSNPAPTGGVKPTGGHVKPTGGEAKPTGTYSQPSGHAVPEHGDKSEWSWPAKYGSHNW